MLRAMQVKAAAIDVDGTLTVARGNTLLDCNGIAAVRLLEEKGVKVVLISGNSVPVVTGLSIYLGASGPSLGENGCVAYYNGVIHHFCEGKPPRELINEITALGFKESWQNKFRFHEAALIPKERGSGVETIVERAVKLAEKWGFTAIWSGYALHIQPPGGGKGTGLRGAAKLLGLSEESFLAIGDGENDVPMLRAAGVSGAPGDASDEAKRVASIVAKAPGARGTLEIVSKVLGVRLREIPVC